VSGVVNADYLHSEESLRFAHSAFKSDFLLNAARVTNVVDLQGAATAIWGRADSFEESALGAV